MPQPLFFGEFVHDLVSTSCVAEHLFVLWHGKCHGHVVNEVWLGLCVVLVYHSAHTHCAPCVATRCANATTHLSLMACLSLLNPVS